MLLGRNIEFMGKEDSQIKIRGNRIQLSEIKFKIPTLDYIEDISVQSNENKEIIVFVTYDNDIEDLKKKMMEDIASLIPEYLLPEKIIVLDKIQLTIRVKIIKRI